MARNGDNVKKYDTPTLAVIESLNRHVGQRVSWRLVREDAKAMCVSKDGFGKVFDQLAAQMPDAIEVHIIGKPGKLLETEIEVKKIIKKSVKKFDTF